MKVQHVCSYKFIYLYYFIVTVCLILSMELPNKKNQAVRQPLTAFFDIKKNHAIVAWFSKGLPMSLENKTPIVYNESMTCQSKIKNTIGGY